MTAPAVLDNLEVAPAPRAPTILFRGLNLAQIDLAEARIEEAVRAALKRVMRQITAKLGATTTAAALIADASSISPDDLSGIGPLWHAQVEAGLRPVVAQVYRDAGDTLHASMVEAVGDLPRVSSVAAETYLAQSATTFDAIGAQLWETARAELIAGMAAGEDIPTLATRLRTTVPDLTARQATLVARTQVNDAANAGSYATAQASGLDLLKGWESTADLRTRESHLFAGSRYSGPGMIPMAENFMVGGWACQRPHDPELPPAERYNCRCTVVYRMAGEPAPPRSELVARLEAEHQRRVEELRLRHQARLERLRAQYEAKLAALAVQAEKRSAAVDAARVAYERRVETLRAEYETRRAALTAEHQRRLAIARGEEPPAPLTGAPRLGEFEIRVQRAAAGNAALRASRVGEITDQTVASDIRHYGLEEYRTVNAALERAAGGPISEDVSYFTRRTIESIDQTLEPLKKDIVVSRGITAEQVEAIFGGADPVAGAEWTGFAFTSTSVGDASRLREIFTGGAGGMRLRILAPKGTRAMSTNPALRRGMPGALDPDEILLDRGLRFRVISDRGVVDGVRQLDVEVVPRAPLPMAAAPGVPEPVIPVAGQPTLVPVRAVLAEAQTVPEVRRAFIAEWDRIIAGQPGAIRGSVRFSSTADVQTVREHAEGLLRGIERFPAVRMDVTSGVSEIEMAYAETVGRRVKFVTGWSRQREEYLASLRVSGARNAEGVSFHPTTISSPQGVALHEFGHIVVNGFAVDPRILTDYQFFNAFMTKVRQSVADLAGERGIPATELVKLEIGEYAAGSTQELLAEAFADAMINGDAASELSRRIFAMLVKEYERVTPPRAGVVEGVVEPLATRAAPLVDDGLDVLELASLRSLATEFEITNASRLGRDRLIAELRQRGAMSPEARRASELAQAQGRAIAETLGMLDAGTDLATITESLTGRAELKDLLAIVRRAKDPDKLATSLREYATRRGITIPTKTQLKALQAAERKAAAAAKREAALAARAEKARQAEVKAQVKAVHAGDFRSLAQTDTGAYRAADGELWTVESFASEREARERVLAMALRDLVEPGGPSPLAIAGQGAPGPGGWQVAYTGTVPRTAVTLDDWLGSASLDQLRKVTPARLRALAGKIGLGPDEVERLIARRADAVTRETLMAKRFRSRGAPLLTDLKALAAETRKGRFIDGSYGSAGLRARVTRFFVDPNDPRQPVEFNGIILQGQRQMGRFSRDLRLDADTGRLVAHHGHLELEESLQGTGFSDEFNANLIDWYRRSGITEVHLTANITIGGYAWARAGYDFASYPAAHNMLRRLEQVVSAIRKGRFTSMTGPWVGTMRESTALGLAQLSRAELVEQIRVAEELLARARRYQFGDPRYPTAHELSQLGRRVGQGRDDMWIGKATMLDSNWSATLYL